MRFLDDYTARRIANWDHRHVRSLLGFIRRQWMQLNSRNWTGDPDTDYAITVNTWHNGINLDLIEALRQNSSVWEMLWKRSEQKRDGVEHVFEIPDYHEPVKPRTPEEIAAAKSRGGFLPRLDNKVLRFLAMLAQQGAECIASRSCGDMLPEADALFTEDEKAEIAVLYEQWNSGGVEEPEWSGQAWVHLGWLTAHLELWADQGMALGPVKE